MIMRKTCYRGSKEAVMIRFNKNKTQYKILSEETLADGSVIIEIKKQYNTSPIGHYLD